MGEEVKGVRGTEPGDVCEETRDGSRQLLGRTDFRGGKRFGCGWFDWR